jgi:putative oxidoreductase
MAFDTAAFASTWTPRALAVLRIVSGYLFLLHGSAKLLRLPHVAACGSAVLLRLSVHLCRGRRPMEC